jgi:hypothetical protein
MSLTAKKTGTLFGTTSISNGTGSGVSNRELQGAATITYGGAPSGYTALSLPGTSGAYMNLGTTHPASFDLETSNLFFECWVYFNSLSIPYQCIIANGPTGSGTNKECWYLRMNPSGAVDFSINETAVRTATSSAILTVGVWYHIAASYNSGSSTAYVFVNGGTPNSVSGATPKTSTDASITLGAYPSPSSGLYTNCYIRDLRVVKGGIVPTTSFTPAAAPFGLGTPTYVAGMGTTVFSLYTQYFFPSWLSLPGAFGSYVFLPSTHPTNFNPGTSNVFIEAWVYWNGATWTTGVTGGAIYERENAGSTAQDYGLYTDGTGKLTSYMYMTDNSTVLRATYNTSTLNVKQWYHVAFGYSPQTKVANVWLNGVVGTPASSATLVARYTTVNTHIGANPFNGSSTVYAWNGYIQDLRVIRGGIIPTGNFTPVSAPFTLLAPSYVPGGTCVLSLATQYFLNTLTRITPSGIAGGYGANVTGGDLTQIIAGNKVHFFTTVGTTTVTVTGSGYVTVLIVAGGGGGGYDRAGGGGAGGLIYTLMILRPGTYSVTVGAGGAGRVGSIGNGANGGNSVFGSLTAIGGGGGGSYAVGSNGGSGGGGHGTSSAAGGTGTANQGNFGGAGLNVNLNCGGGGGAGGPGIDGGTGVNAVGGNGGPGQLIAISGTPTYYAGGGGGSIAFDSFSGTSGKGLGGVGGGGNSGQVPGANGSPGTANTGGGGGGGANIPQGNGGQGGSGIVIISYPTAIPVQITNNSIFLNLSASAVNSSVAAYSLRALRASTAKAVQIRRSTDSAIQDFYADRLGNLLTLASTGETLSSWLGSATGYVATWYDQSGQGKDLTQSTTSLQPTVSLATSPPSLVFTGSGTSSGQYLLNSAFSFNFGTNYQYSIRAVVNNTVGGCLIYKGASGFPWNLAGYKKWWFGTLNGIETTTGGYPSHVGNSEGYVYGLSGIKPSKMSVTWSSSAFSSVGIYEKSSSVPVSYNRGSQFSDPSTYLYLGVGGGAAYYNGNVYEIEIFSIALSASDVTNLE